MLKPDKCSGCPLYNKSKAGFVADHIPAHTKLFVIFDSPAKNFAGHSAEETWDAKYFRNNFQLHAGLQDDEVAYMHMYRCKDAGFIKGKVAKDSILHCRQYDLLQEDSVVATQGEKGWKFFSGMTKRKDMAGYYVETTIGISNADTLDVPDSSDMDDSDTSSDDE